MTGSWNDLRCAYFSGKHRLAVDNGEHVRLYDTGGRTIRGFCSSDGQTLTLDTEDGAHKLSSLKLV